MLRKGMLGALMDEYDRASADLVQVLEEVPGDSYIAIQDSDTKDEDCRSIQTVCNHVIRAGYAYASYINSIVELPKESFDREMNAPIDFITEMIKMLAFSERAINNISHLTEKEMEATQLKTTWGVTYDVEQLLEHAIVHILRHRRQIENWLSLPKE